MNRRIFGLENDAHFSENDGRLGENDAHGGDNEYIETLPNFGPLNSYCLVFWRFIGEIL